MGSASEWGKKTSFLGVAISVFPDVLRRLFTFPALVKLFVTGPQEVSPPPRCVHVTIYKQKGFLNRLFFHQFKRKQAIRPKAEVFPVVFNTVIHRVCG